MRGVRMNVVPFCFKDNVIRTITDALGEPWFVAKDVCDALGLDNITWALNGLDDDELTLEKLNAGGQTREMKLISESGLYTLIIRSNKPQAKPFRRWVTHEVLPSIRKTGSYSRSSKSNSDPRDLVGKNILKACRIIESELRVCKRLGINLTTARHRAVVSARQATGIDYAQLLPAVPLRDPVFDFLEDSCELGDAGYYVESSELYAAYQAWAEDVKTAVSSQTKFNEVISGIPGVFKKRPRLDGKRATVFRGIRLIATRLTEKVEGCNHNACD